MNTISLQRLAIPVLGLSAAAAAALVPQLAFRIAFELVVAAATSLGTWRAFALTSAARAVSGNDSTASPPIEVVSYRRDRRNPIFDRETGMFVDWYFRLRLEEEIARATRFGERFCVAIASPDVAERQHMLAELKSSLRKVDYGAELGGTIAVVLPNTNRAGGETWRSRRPGAEFIARLAEFPTDGQTVSALLGEDLWALRPQDGLAA